MKKSGYNDSNDGDFGLAFLGAVQWMCCGIVFLPRVEEQKHPSHLYICDNISIVTFNAIYILHVNMCFFVY